MEVKPEFFRIFMLHVNSTRMRVCDAFLAKLSDDDFIPKRVALRNSLKKAFCVKVSVENSGVYFDEGWTEFVAENGLETGFILVFRFDGHCGFDVKIFDHSGCEKYMCEDDIEEGEGIEDVVVVDDNGEEDEDEDYGVEEDENVDVEEDEDVEEEDDDGVDGSDSDDCTADLSDGTYANPTEAKNIIHYHRKRDTHRPKKPSGHVTAKHPQEFRDNAVVLHPKNPFFVAKMKKQNVSPSYPARFLYVPMSFAKNHLKKFTAPGTLLDPKKITWSIKVRYTKSNKNWFLGYGWTAFVKGNKLQVGDTCVFELIEPEPLQLKVSIFRVVIR